MKWHTQRFIIHSFISLILNHSRAVSAIFSLTSIISVHARWTISHSVWNGSFKISCTAIHSITISTKLSWADGVKFGSFVCSVLFFLVFFLLYLCIYILSYVATTKWWHIQFWVFNVPKIYFNENGIKMNVCLQAHIKFSSNTLRDQHTTET